LLNNRARRERNEMLKITKTEASGSKVIMKLEGKITSQWASLLDEECRNALRAKQTVELDCAAVDFLDQRGVEVLQNLSPKQVTLINAPGYVMELLQIGGR
jgi:anti-anti-sigma regulatory factor